MAFFVAENDEVCPHKTAYTYIPQMQTETTIIDVPDDGHMYFAMRANSDWFMSNLTEQLQVPTTHSVD